MKIVIKLLIISIISISMFSACKQNKSVESNSTEKMTMGDNHAAPMKERILTPEQKEMLKSRQEKINDLSPKDKQRYNDFIKEVGEAKTGSELKKVVDKYKDLTKRIR